LNQSTRNLKMPLVRKSLFAPREKVGIFISYRRADTAGQTAISELAAFLSCASIDSKSICETSQCAVNDYFMNASAGSRLNLKKITRV